MPMTTTLARNAAATLALCIAALPAAAACGPDSNQMELTECAGASFNAADANLNQRYKSILDRLDGQPDKAELLRAAQRAWITFRDAECAFATSGVAGGSIEPMVDAECRTRLTTERTEALGTYLKCEEGDTTCPVPPQ